MRTRPKYQMTPNVGGAVMHYYFVDFLLVMRDHVWMLSFLGRPQSSRRSLWDDDTHN